MDLLHLTPQQRFRLRRLRDTTHDAALLRRTLALLQIDQGQPVAEVAAAVGVSRQSVYNWLDRYLTAPTPRALRDCRGQGHVTAWDEDLRAVLRAALEQPPTHWGYRDLEWTVPLLQEHLARWDGRSWSETTLRRQLHDLDYVWKRPRYVLRRDPRRARKIRRIRQQVKDLGPRAALLFEDETDLLLFPPLRACWTQRGESAEVPLSGRNARRVVFGAIHVQTGHRLLLPRRHQRGEDFRAFLRLVHEHYRGWQVWLLLDEDSSHTADDSAGLAREYQIGLLWLPKRCPELNAMDHLWGHAKDEICANHQDPSIDHLVDCFIRYIQGLSAEEARRKGGILSEDFWLKEECQI
jgi:transposase